MQEQLLEIGSNAILSLLAAALGAHLAGSLISSAPKRWENEPRWFYGNIENIRKTTVRTASASAEFTADTETVSILGTTESSSEIHCND